MFILGHIGLTIGLIILGLIIFKKSELIYSLDLRIIAFFAILPDLFDKVFGYLIFGESLSNGRLFSHTLVFLILFSIVFLLIVRIRWWIYAVPIVTHHVFDRLCEDPYTFFWPYFGWSFKSLDVNVWQNWFQALLTDPYIKATEIIGFIILISIFIYFRGYLRANFVKILKTGKMTKQP